MYLETELITFKTAYSKQIIFVQNVLHGKGGGISSDLKGVVTFS